MAEGMKNKAWIRDKLIENADKNFVRRLFKKDAPQLDIGEGRVATHQMSWGHTGPPGQKGTKIIVYPNIIHDKNTKGLRWLSGRDAQTHAEDTKEYIEVASEEEADELSRGYKEAVPSFNGDPQGRGGPGSQSMDPEYREMMSNNKRKLGLLPPKKEKKKSGK